MKLKPGSYINRELSWLEFNQRVLDEAHDPGVPLLERAKFLAITASNLDEFFMVRVGSLHLMLAGGFRRRDPAGLSPQKQIQRLAARAHAMVRDQYRCCREELEPALSAAGIRRLKPCELTSFQKKQVEERFSAEVAPVITPMAVHADRPFPPLRSLSLHVAVRLAPDREGGERRFAVVPIGAALPRIFALSTGETFSYLLLEDVVRMCAASLFPGEPVLECTAFRLCRNADLAVQDEVAADLLAEMETILAARKRSDCVRLEIEQSASAATLAFLTAALQVRHPSVYRVPGPLDLSHFMSLANMEGHDELKDKPWPPQPSPALDPNEGIFDELSRKTVLLCHPFESFDPVLRLVTEAADDPDVLAIKQILYRTSRNSPIVAALRRAAERGKYVTALLELKARFDEARNIEWARELEEAGVQVIYGVRGLKTHAKLCIVVRREPRGVVRYLHFGTGNYNEVTARLYTDISLLTANADLAADATAFFNAITGYSQPLPFLKLAAAPQHLRETLLGLIEAEAERSRRNQKALILAKMNSLADPALIAALYKASQAGVRIRLNVRGVCCLRPGVPGLSENISVVSIIDRFLEHSRIFYFRNGGDDRVFISSADWMPRNLDRRVELLVPVEDRPSRRRLIGILRTCLRDAAKGRVMQADGSYARPAPGARRRGVRSQLALHREAAAAISSARQIQRTVFVPHRPPEENP